MELQYLKYFSSVADTLSFSEAAKRCRVSQPSLSAQVKILEDRLGTQLFHRNKRTVSLTKEGKALLPRVKKILTELEGLSTAAKELQNPLSGTLYVGATPLIPHTAIFDKLTSLAKDNPGLKYSFTEGGSNALVEGLLSGQLDIIFLPNRSQLNSPQIDFRITEHMEVRVCSPHSGVKDLPFIAIRSGCGLGEFMTESAKRLGKDNDEMLHATHIEMIKKWIQLEMGWSILPASLISKLDEKKFKVENHKVLKPIEICTATLKSMRSKLILENLSTH